MNSFEVYQEKIRQKNMNEENPIKGILFVLVIFAVALTLFVAMNF